MITCSLRRFLLFSCIALALTGCATGQAEYYAAETARHAAEGARWESMGRIAVSGDVTAKAVALAVMGQSGAGQQQATAAPRSPAADWLQFVGVLLPAAIQGYGIRQHTQLGMRQSDNGARTSIAADEYGFKGLSSTNAAFEGIAGRIQAPGAVTTSTTGAVTTSTTGTTTTTGPVTDTRTYTANPVTTTANPVTITTTPPAAPAP